MQDLPLYPLQLNLEIHHLTGHGTRVRFVGNLYKDIRVPFVPYKGLLVILPEYSYCTETLGWKVDDNTFVATCKITRTIPELAKAHFTAHGWHERSWDMDDDS